MIENGFFTLNISLHLDKIELIQVKSMIRMTEANLTLTTLLIWPKHFYDEFQNYVQHFVHFL